MKFLVTSLPSGGKTLKDKNIQEIEINPLPYKKIIKYQQSKSQNPITRYIFDIENLIQDIPNWRDLCSYDLSSIIFTRKYLTASSGGSFRVELSGKIYEINTNDITFKDLNDEYLNMKSVELNGKTYLVHIPTIGEFYDNLKKFEPRYKDESWITPYDIMILTALGAEPITIMDYVFMYGNLSDEDIVTVEYLDTVINNVTNDITIKSSGGDAVISVDKLITDLFRFISLNRRLNDAKINFK